MSKLFSVTAVLGIALALAAMIHFERAETRTWNERLVWPRFSEEPNRHTPRFATGTFLPPVISQDLTLGPADNPIILSKKTVVTPETTLTLAAGAQLFAHEFAELHLDGKLEASGTPANPIVFTSNELHPANQHWAGLTFHPASQGVLAHIVIKHASPAISCLRNSYVRLNQAQLQKGALGLYTESVNCSLSQSSLAAFRDGIIAIGVNPQVINTSIDVFHEKIIIR